MHRIKVLWQVQDEAREVEKGQLMQDLIKDFGLYHKSNEKSSQSREGHDPDIPLAISF